MVIYTKRVKDRPHYLVVNADSQGKCKDRNIVAMNRINCLKAVWWLVFDACACIYIYIRGEFVNEARRLQMAIDEAYDAGLLGKNAAVRLGF